MQLIDFLEAASRKSPSVPAVVEAESAVSVTYEELWNSVHKLSCQLRNLGLERQDRVILALPNSIDWIVSFFAILMSGGVVVPVRQSSASSELKWIINKTKPTIFIGESSFINKSLPFDLLDDGHRVVILGKKVLKRVNGKRRINDLRDLMHGSPLFPNGDGLQMVPTSDIAAIHFTYRGYGYPLGAMFNDANYIEGIKAYAYTVGIDHPLRFLAILPFGYMYPLVGCVLVPLTSGSTIIIGRDISPQKVWDAIRKWNINVLTGVPSFFSALIGSANGSCAEASEITHALCGGSLMPVNLYRRFKERLNISLRQGYGLTECLPVTCNPSHDNRPDTLGKISVGSRGIDLKIFDVNGTEKSIGEVGEIVVTGPTVMKGYYGMPQETNHVLKNGWLYTGDLGWFDNDGYLHFSGLKKRIAKVGGHMVDLTEVEKRMLGISGISSVNVYSIPDDRWGEVLGADIVSTNGSIDSRMIRHSLKPYLATYKVPKILRSLA